MPRRAKIREPAARPYRRRVRDAGDRQRAAGSAHLSLGERDASDNGGPSNVALYQRRSRRQLSQAPLVRAADGIRKKGRGLLRPRVEAWNVALVALHHRRMMKFYLHRSPAWRTKFANT